MLEEGIKVFPDWPGYSPDMNPQGNVWAWAENELRRQKNEDDPFAIWTKRTLKACRAYPSSDKLVGSMAKRMRNVHKADGAITKYRGTPSTSRDASALVDVGQY